jgi:hypothetical protein
MNDRASSFALPRGGRDKPCLYKNRLTLPCLAPALARPSVIYEFKQLARLTFERAADAFEIVQADGLGFSVSETPEARVSDVCFFCQPVKSLTALFKQLLDS